VTQTSYQQPSTCATCNGQHQPVVIQQASPAQPTYGNGSASGATGNGSAPSIEPNASVPIQREEQRPVTDGAEAQPAPGDDSNGFDPYDPASSENSTYLQPPKLFDPNDRTAQRHIAPVTTALYQKPVSYRNVSTQPVTAQQVKQDAIGWTSASN
jgi:hypothetical protein